MGGTSGEEKRGREILEGEKLWVPRDEGKREGEEGHGDSCHFREPGTRKFLFCSFSTSTALGIWGNSSRVLSFPHGCVGSAFPLLLSLGCSGTRERWKKSGQYGHLASVGRDLGTAYTASGKRFRMVLRPPSGASHSLLRIRGFERLPFLTSLQADFLEWLL